MTTNTLSRAWRARWRPVAVLVIPLAWTVGAAAQEPPQDSAPAAAPAPAKTPWRKTIVANLAYGRHDAGESIGQSVTLYLSRAKVAWILSGGYQSIIGERGVGVGVTYQREVVNGVQIGVGGATGTNIKGGIFPKYEVGGWSRVAVAPGLGVQAGFSRRAAQDFEAHTDRIGLGFTWYAPGPWIVGGDVGYSIGSPGNTESWSGGAGLTYEKWEKLYVGVVVRYADARYVALPSQSLVEFTGWGYNAGVTKYFTRDFTIGVSAGHSDYYGGGAVTVSVGRSW
jgi:hypothetical protein